MSEAYYLDDVALSDFGCTVIDSGSWHSSVELQRDSVPLVGTHLTIPAALARVRPRRIPIGLVLKDVTQANRIAAQDALFRAFSGLVEVRASDDDRVCYGYVERAPTQGWPAGKEWARGPLQLVAEIVCYDPVKYAKSWKTIGLPEGEAVTIPGGTLPTYGIVTVFGDSGPATDPSIVTRRLGDVELGRMDLDVTLNATDAIEVDTRPYYQQLRRVQSGVWGQLPSALPVGSGFFFGVEPGDTIELEGAGGVFDYQDAYA